MIQQIYSLTIKINNCRGEISDISAKTAILTPGDDVKNRLIICKTYELRTECSNKGKNLRSNVEFPRHVQSLFQMQSNQLLALVQTTSSSVRTLLLLTLHINTVRVCTITDHEQCVCLQNQIKYYLGYVDPIIGMTHNKSNYSSG